MLLAAVPLPDAVPTAPEVSCPVVVAYGDLDPGTTDRWEAECLTAARSGPGDLVVDLSAVTFFGASAVHLLVRVMAALAERDGRLVVVRPTRIATRVLTVCGLEGLIDRGQPRRSPR